MPSIFQDNPSLRKKNPEKNLPYISIITAGWKWHSAPPKPPGQPYINAERVLKLSSLTTVLFPIIFSSVSGSKCCTCSSSSWLSPLFRYPFQSVAIFGFAEKHLEKLITLEERTGEGWGRTRALASPPSSSLVPPISLTHSRCIHSFPIYPFIHHFAGCTPVCLETLETTDVSWCRSELNRFFCNVQLVQKGSASLPFFNRHHLVDGVQTKKLTLFMVYKLLAIHVRVLLIKRRPSGGYIIIL